MLKLKMYMSERFTLTGKAFPISCSRLSHYYKAAWMPDIHLDRDFH